MRRSKTIFLLLLTNILSAVLALELGIRYFVLGESRMFEYSAKSGWKPKSNLDIVRSDNYGDWRVMTNSRGIRVGPIDGESNGEDIDPEWVILGDSFAFGEGVSIDERFDIINSSLTDNSINLGVMGYSPLQSFMRVAEVGLELKDRQKILLLVYANDVKDSREYMSAFRKRPVLEDGEIVFPDSNVDKFHGFMRDSFYSYYLLVAYLFKPENQMSQTDLSQNLTYILSNTNSEVHIVFHGFDAYEADSYLESEVCRLSACYKFEINRSVDSSLFLENDLHWNFDGHKAFSYFLSKHVLSSQ